MSSSSHRLAASRPDLSRRRLVVAGLVLALLASLGGLAPIAVDPVRAAGPWHVSPTGGGSNDGSDCANAFAGIQAGVTAAAPGETIRLCDGTYALGAPVTVDKSDLRFEGETTTGTVVDGADATRLFDASGRNVTFFGLTLTNGSVTGRGGAVIATNVTLVGVDATSNTASGSGTDGFGGAVYGVSGVSVSGGSYTDNVASGNGGAIATGGALSITSGEFIGNRAIGRGGGAVFA
ncbi:MAG: hypothetical protein RL338_1815, partial [Chloroflexota bacterium]